MDALRIAVDHTGFTLFVSWVAIGVGFLLLLILWASLRRVTHPELEISEAELGIGHHKIKIRPNHDDVQIAYKLWVEVSTRKIGLPIDLQHDVIAEIYDSWYDFFRVTRELIKEIPARKIRRSQSTEHIVYLAVEVLNEGLRPHLTSWQARFRRWYERELLVQRASETTPQDLQREYPRYDELVADLLMVNRRLIRYRELLRAIAMGPSHRALLPPARGAA